MQKKSDKSNIFHDKKILKKLEKEGTYLNTIKAIYNKLNANIINGEYLKAFSVKSGMR
jgi:hypothetical protein